jgi:hypothetical protein
MSSIERELLSQARLRARKHLQLITAQPGHYLRKLPYAMDFVWAKFAFCFLLLLKLSRLVPENSQEFRELLDEGNQMLAAVSLSSEDEEGQMESREFGPVNEHNIYLQIIKLSIEKFGKTIDENGMDSAEQGLHTIPALETGQNERLGDFSGPAAVAAPGSFWELLDAQTDLQYFVPRQFVSEWDFPGLNLFYFPTAWQDFFNDFSLNV